MNNNFHGTGGTYRLPPEVLSYIFHFATYDTHSPLSNYTNVQDDTNEDTDPPHPLFHTMITPWRLTQVNRRWRTLGRGLSSLWTTIYVHGRLVKPDHEDEDERELYEAFLKEHLKRSGDRPLDIFFDGRDPDWEATQMVVDRKYRPVLSQDELGLVIDHLVEHLWRWRTFTLYTDEWCAANAALKPIQKSLKLNGAPILEKLILVHQNARISHGAEFFPSKLEEPMFLNVTSRSPSLGLIIPCLQSLVLKGVHVEWDRLPRMLSESRNPGGLVEFELYWQSLATRPTLRQIRAVLAASERNLERLALYESVEVVFDDDGSDTTNINGARTWPEPVKLSRLSSLTLAYRSPAEAHTILGLFEARNLKSLTLECLNESEVITGGHTNSLEDNGELLAYIGTGRSLKDLLDNQHRFTLAWYPKRGYRTLPPPCPSDPEAWIALPIVTTLTPTGLANTRYPNLKPRFPKVEELALRYVSSDHLLPMQHFFASMPDLRTLELMTGRDTQILVDPIRALLSPIQAEKNTTDTIIGPCCCSQLRLLRLRHFRGGNSGTDWFIRIAESLVALRPAREGGSTLREIEVWVDGTLHAGAGGNVVRLSIPGSEVRFFEEEDPDDDED